VLEQKDRLLGEVVAKSWWVSFDHDIRIASARLRAGVKGPGVADVIEMPPLG
jgi:hypothetical protein